MQHAKHVKMAGPPTGTPELLEEARSVPFLLRCLRKARLEPDLVQDVCDACELNEMDATSLAVMEAEECASKLFLMQDEARQLIRACRRQCLRLGLSFGDDGDLSGEQSEDVSDEPVVATPPLGNC